MKPRLLAFSAVALAACAGGSMYDQPYGLIEPHQVSATEDLRPAMILKIDGTSRPVNRNDPVPPGQHTVEVSIPGPPGMSDPGRDTLTIDVKPCTRYLLGATRSSRTARDWQAGITSTEPIGKCQKKFGAK